MRRSNGYFRSGKHAYLDFNFLILHAPHDPSIEYYLEIMEDWEAWAYETSLKNIADGSGIEEE